jgi:hypothetical protein
LSTLFPYRRSSDLELAEWYATYGTAVDHPLNAARSDTFDVHAADRVWFKPHGIDNRWIRGVR